MQGKLELGRLVVVKEFGQQTDPYAKTQSNSVTLSHLGTGQEVVVQPIPDEVMAKVIGLFRGGTLQKAAPPPAHPPESAPDAGFSFEVGGEDMSGLDESDPTSSV
jgi:hypothetical protein